MEPGQSFPLASYIDQTILRPTATLEDVRAEARLAAGYGFASLCLPPWAVADAAGILSGSATKVQTVVGFPLGFQPTKVKVFEAGLAVEDGAGEIDMVVNRGCIRAGAMDRVEEEIAAVVDAVRPVGVKTILEISDLSIEEILAGCDAAVRAGARFVKTSTGFFGAGADVDVVRRITAHAAGRIQVKASGGIRDLRSAWEFIQAGASRVGTSSGVAIIEAFRSSSR